MKSIALLASLILLPLAAGLHAQTPEVTSAKPAYRTGENIVITFTNGPANAKDWIGIYPATAEPGGAAGSTIWFYVDGTKDGATGLAHGVITFTNGLPNVGSWVAYLLENDGYTKLASVSFTTVPGPSITTDKAFYATNETIQVTFANGPGNPKDWIGIYPDGASPGGPSSTLWNYVNGTQTSTVGLTSGTITFTNGLSAAGKWTAYFLENDGYTKLASTSFSVGSVPVVQAEHSTYFVGSPITLAFTNGPANAKDWIGVYPEGSVPGGPPSTIWQYTDGGGGSAGKSSGTINFSSGLTNAGVYVAYFLENDGYKVLASNRFSVVALDAPLLWLDKRSYEARTTITASFTNAPGNAKDWVGIYPAGVTPGSVGSTIWLYLDGTQGGAEIVPSGAIAFANGLNTVGDWVAYLLENDGYTILAQESFKVTPAPKPVPTNNLVLGTPLYLETFDATPEGQLPAGWTTRSFTEVLDEAEDLGDLNSKSYANWVVVSASRFNSSLFSYTGHTPTDDYKRVLATNLDNVVNGVTLTNLGTGNILFADSGYRSGRSQVLFVSTPDYNLTGATNLYLSFHSLYEQNQDSFGALELSLDGGTNWLPVLYLIDQSDVLTNGTGQIDAVATLTTEYPDVAYYDDPDTGETKGGTYAAFVGAPISQDLAPYISPRVNDDAIESKRVEYLRVAAADNQPRVRFRFAYAGTDSWYWGLDDFGIYGASTSTPTPARLTIARADNKVTVTWTGGDGRLQKATSLAPSNWQEISVPGGSSSFTDNVSGPTAFYRVVR